MGAAFAPLVPDLQRVGPYETIPDGVRELRRLGLQGRLRLAGQEFLHRGGLDPTPIPVPRIDGQGGRQLDQAQGPAARTGPPAQEFGETVANSQGAVGIKGHDGRRAPVRRVSRLRPGLAQILQAPHVRHSP